MGRELRTQLEVAAPAPLAWSVLADFASYPEWNPFIIEVRGAAAEGTRIRYRFEFPRGVRVWTDAEILSAQPDHELRWAAHFLSPRIFNGEHYFKLTPVSATSVVFHHGEIFTGGLLPVALPVLQRTGPAIYRNLNTAFKARVESLL